MTRIIVSLAAGRAEFEQERLIEERGSRVVDPVRGVRLVEYFVFLSQIMISDSCWLRIEKITHRVRMPELKPHIPPITEIDIKPPSAIPLIFRRLARPPLSPADPQHETIRPQLLSKVTQNIRIGRHVGPAFLESARFRVRPLDIDSEDVAWPMKRSQ